MKPFADIRIPSRWPNCKCSLGDVADGYPAHLTAARLHLDRHLVHGSHALDKVIYNVLFTLGLIFKDS